MRVKGKVAIVTGAAQGIGKCYAETLAREGASVALVDLQEEAVEAAAAEIGAAGGAAAGMRGDISDPASMRQVARSVADRFGGIDVLVNNAAMYAGYVHYSFMDLPLDYWQKFLDVNLTGTLVASQAVIPHLIERGKGKIINQSSAGAQMPMNHYGVTKLGVQGLTVGLARNLGRHNINVNCIAPGPTDTEATRGHYTQEQLEGIVKRFCVIKRPGTVQDMASALIYLASDESDWVTGQTLHVDGGFVMHPA